MMFEVSKRWKRVLLQVVVTIMVLPYLFPLVVMLQGSLAGQGFENYKAVAKYRASPVSSSTAPSFRSALSPLSTSAPCSPPMASPN